MNGITNYGSGYARCTLPVMQQIKNRLAFATNNKPHFCGKKPLHSGRLTIWTALSFYGMLGLYFYDHEHNGETVTLIAERYLKILTRNFIPSLRGRVFSNA